MLVSEQKVVCILGPTATGKSTLAVDLARFGDGEIVNFDSRQVYRSFPLITAQPEPELRALCRHWLYGFLETHEPCDAGGFTSLARERVRDIAMRGRPAILVGGTGLYLRSFLQGLAPIPAISAEVREAVLAQLQEHGAEALHRQMSRYDPETARRIHPRDRQRLTRALEVFQETGKPMSWWQKQLPADQSRYQSLKLGVWKDLEVLEPKLKERIAAMLDMGALQEVQQAWRSCPDESAPGWSAIGCRELLEYHLGRWPLEKAKEEWFRRTRAYAKRQLTWFKKEKNVQWVNPKDLAKVYDVLQKRFFEAC